MPSIPALSVGVRDRRPTGPKPRRSRHRAVLPYCSAAGWPREATTVAVHGSGALASSCPGVAAMDRRSRVAVSQPAALRRGRPAKSASMTEPPRRGTRALTPRGDRSASTQRVTVLRTRGWRDGACGPRAHPGAHHPRAGTQKRQLEGPWGSAWRGPRSRQDPRPQRETHHETARPRKDEGRRNRPDALRYGYDWNMRPARDVARPVGPVRRRARGWPGVDSLDGSSQVRPSGRPPPGSRKN